MKKILDKDTNCQAENRDDLKSMIIRPTVYFLAARMKLKFSRVISLKL